VEKGVVPFSLGSGFVSCRPSPGPTSIKQSLQQTIDRTAHRFVSQFEHMRKNHRHPDIFVAQQFLNRPDVIPGTQQVGRKTVSESVTPHPLGDSRFDDCFPDGLFQ
jgi:hypothetical protein